MHPGERREFELIGGAERSVDLHALGLLEAHDHLGEGIIVRIATVPIDSIAPTSASRSEYRKAVYCAPASECWMTPVTSSPTRSLPIEALEGVQRQVGGHLRHRAPPDDPAENSSVTHAVSAILDQVGAYVQSTTHSRRAGGFDHGS